MVLAYCAVMFALTDGGEAHGFRAPKDTCPWLSLQKQDGTMSLKLKVKLSSGTESA